MGSNCGYYNRVMARKNLVDGSDAYKNRKFPEAEKLFRDAIARDPKGEHIEGRMAQLFLARTLHSEFIGNRQDQNKAREAISEYQKALALDPKDQSSYKAIASLYENLQMTDQWLDWVTKRSKDMSIPAEQRAEALTSLAAKKNTCANDISDSEAVKKTVTKDGKQAFQFVKPASNEEYETLKKCIEEGNVLIEEAVKLETDPVKNAKSFNIKGATNAQLKATQDEIKIFESARSYRASLLYQSMRLAEMDGRGPDKDRFKTEADAARAKYMELSDVVKNIQTEIDERVAAEEAAKPGATKNTNAAANVAK